LSPVFGTRGSEVQILSPRPYKPININQIQTHLQRTHFARSPKKSPIRKGAERNLEDIRERLKAAKEDGDLVRTELKLANQKLAEMHEKSLTIARARFPYNLNALIDFIDAARGELAVTCDFIGYAMYSNVSGFLQYFAALQRAAERKVKIRLLLYGLDTARQAIEKQLSTP
jgi:phosphatidylserine/phosphatidylglycerophosphate/cardiolipin synthase-like enzyme